MNPRFLLFVFLIFFSSLKAQNEFITVWKPSNPSVVNTTVNQIKFPGIGTNYTIYWEEANYPAHNATLSNVTSTTANPVLIDFGTAYNPIPANATYILKVSNGTGTFSQIKFYENILTIGDHDKIITVNQWGNIAWTSMANAFYRCHNLDVTATDIPNTSNVSDFSGMFKSCTSLIRNISFNTWNMSFAINFSEMFSESIFNQPITNWSTSNVTNMSRMFSGSAFNQLIGSWDTGKVNNMRNMFASNTIFNQPIGNWNTSNVTDMSEMFFYNTGFNQSIGNWDTSKVSNMNAMFSNSLFNQPIGNWNTGKVNNMDYMFYNSKFNQPIGNWDTSKVTGMMVMFYKASEFDQDLGNWDLRNIFAMGSMLAYSKLSCANYDKTLIGWANNPNTRNNVNMGSAYSLKYSSAAASAARNTLVTTKGWAIGNDTYDPSCASSLATSETAIGNDIIFYPNPVKNTIYLKPENKLYDIKIYTIDGRIAKNINQAKTCVNMTDLPKGIYFLNITTDGKTVREKFIKE